MQSSPDAFLAPNIISRDKNQFDNFSTPKRGLFSNTASKSWISVGYYLNVCSQLN